jgi:glycosyltransferase involved in cell wall biosynthesis
MKNYNKLVSIVIPCYEMHDNGVSFLDSSLSRIANQTYKNIQVVISDHSLNDNIQKLCEKWSRPLNLKYLKNNINIGSSSSNVNNAINNSDGEIIKILFQDDFLYEEKSIEVIVDNFDVNDMWLVTSCYHTTNGIDMFNKHNPVWNDNIHLGINTISSPSVLALNKNVSVRFDEELIWLMDCDIYKKLYINYGLPKIIHHTNVVNRLWGNRLSDTISNGIKESELNKMKKKYL